MVTYLATGYKNETTSYTSRCSQSLTSRNTLTKVPQSEYLQSYPDNSALSSELFGSCQLSPAFGAFRGCKSTRKQFSSRYYHRSSYTKTDKQMRSNHRNRPQFHPEFKSILLCYHFRFSCRFGDGQGTLPVISNMDPKNLLIDKEIW